MLEELKLEVYEANLSLPKHKLVKYTWGNVSGIDRNKNMFVIKPSGVKYDELQPADMVVCDLDGNVIEGRLNPSSDTPTHAYLYKHLPEIGGIVHTHSTWATSWAQAGIDIPPMGTTHADTFYGTIPCARYLLEDEVNEGYEQKTGQVIIETFKSRKINPMSVPAVILHGHGPFTWGKTAQEAVMHSVVLEEICQSNYYARELNHFSKELPQHILDKHYLRKHGENAYYGQR